MDNPLEESDEENEVEIKTYDISVFLVVNRGKKVTYMCGWLDNKNELVDHLKILKHRHGCNGSVKFKTLSDNEKKLYFMLQGDWKEQIIDYIKEKETMNPINFIRN